jgi:Ankyrin repeat
MDDVKTVLVRSSEFEKILKSKFRAEGDGLGQQVRNIQKLLPVQLVKKLRWISGVRNKAAHDPLSFQMPEKFLKICDEAKVMLDQVERAIANESKVNKISQPIQENIDYATLELESIQKKRQDLEGEIEFDLFQGLDNLDHKLEQETQIQSEEEADLLREQEVLSSKEKMEREREKRLQEENQADEQEERLTRERERQEKLGIYGSFNPNRSAYTKGDRGKKSWFSSTVAASKKQKDTESVKNHNNFGKNILKVIAFLSIVIIGFPVLSSVIKSQLSQMAKSSRNQKIQSNADMLLRRAANTCDYKLAKAAFNEGGRPNIVVNDFVNTGTALVQLIKTNGNNADKNKLCLPVIKLLLDNQADPNLEGPLHFAAHQANNDMIKLLLKRGANPKVAFKGGFANGIPLAWFIAGNREHTTGNNAISAGNAAYNEKVLATLLAAHTSNINEQNEAGDTLLIQLVKTNTSPVEIIERLIKLGADPKHKNKEGKTAYDYAVTENHDQNTIKLLNGYR